MRDAAVEAVFQPVRPPTTFEETVERLGTAIRVGLLAPGSKLPSERQLAEELRISRSTLRQALTTLVQSGHLTSARGRSGGTFVAERPPLHEREEDPLGRDGWAVLDHRVAIEVGAVILAAERAERPTSTTWTSSSSGWPAQATSRCTGAPTSASTSASPRRPSPHLVTQMTEVQGQMSDLIGRIAHPEEVLIQRAASEAGPSAARPRRRRAVPLMRKHIRGTEHILGGLI